MSQQFTRFAAWFWHVLTHTSERGYVCLATVWRGRDGPERSA